MPNNEFEQSKKAPARDAQPLRPSSEKFAAVEPGEECEERDSGGHHEEDKSCKSCGCESIQSDT